MNVDGKAIVEFFDVHELSTRGGDRPGTTPWRPRDDPATITLKDEQVHDPITNESVRQRPRYLESLVGR